MRDLFEFSCPVSGGGCGGYIAIPLQIEDERDVIIVCPSCGHQHYRGMKNGEITERRHSYQTDNATVHRIEPTLAAYSQKPKLQKLAERGFLGDLWSRAGGRN